MHDESDLDRRLQKYPVMANRIGDELSKRGKRKKTHSNLGIFNAKDMDDYDLESLIADNTGYVGNPTTKYHQTLLALKMAEDKYGEIITDIKYSNQAQRWNVYTPNKRIMVHNICRSICIEIVNTIIRVEKLEV